MNKHQLLGAVRMLVNRTFLLAVLLFFIVSLVIWVDIPIRTRLWNEVENFGHVIVFGTAALVSYQLLERILRRRFSGAGTRYFLAFILAVSLGFGTELLQRFVNRDAEMRDLLRDVAGASSFLLLCGSRGNQLSVLLVRNRRRVQIFFRVIGLVIIAFCLVPTLIWAVAYLDRDIRFPVVCDFSTPLSRKFVEARSSKLEVCLSLDSVLSREGEFMGKVTMEKGDYPGITVFEPYPDWSAYSRLTFAVYYPGTDSFRLGVRVDDTHHNFSYDDRYTESFIMAHGVNRIEIPLDSVRFAPAGRQTDMREIAALWLFVPSLEKDQTIYLTAIRLE